jgi:sugar (Glycoside-Pentoside-Hexuronide) transporter/PTS system, glucose subfamily, IIA component
MDSVNPNISKLKLSKLTLVAYGAGDFASNMCWTFIGTYLSVFYTDALGLAPALASVLMMLARISDGIFDPVFGAIAERTRSKYGRFRPYILFGAPVLALLTVLCFTMWGSGGTGTAAMAFIMYLLCGFAYTIVNLSYGSLSTVMTTDPDDIAQLNSFRMIGTNLSAVVLNAVTPPLLIFFSGSSQITSHGYTAVAILFALMSLPIFYFTALNCKERIHPVADGTKVKLSKTVKTVIENGPLMLIFLIQLLAMTAFFGRMGVLAYYCLYNVKNTGVMALFMSLPSLATVVGIFATKNYIVKVGKKKMAAIGYIGAAACLTIMFFVGQSIGYSNLPLLIALNTLYGFFCFSFPIPMAMVTDAINYGEDKYGVRSDGTSYATVSLSTKLGQAIGVSAAIAIMGAAGYVANSQQSAAAMTGINFSTNMMMAILYVLCLVPLFFYPLNEKAAAKILDRLTVKREAIDFSNDNFGTIASDKVVVASGDTDNIVSKHEKVVDIYSMADGQMMPLNKVSDPMFSKGIVGTGFAIKPTDGKITSPVNGTVITVFKSKHAIGIQSDDGLEILIHMGINTYDMKGKPFTVDVKAGDKVSAGSTIADIDLKQLKDAGKPDEILFIITNNRITKRLVFDEETMVSTGSSVGRIIIK